MAWNQPGEDKKRAPPPRGAPEKRSLDELLRRLQRQAQRLWRPGGNRATTALALLLLLAAVWLISGYYQIAASERGVVQRMGRYVSVEQPGHGWHWPWPIESITKVDVVNLESLDSKALMLTADQSLLDVSWSLQYRIVDPLRFLFQVRDPQETLRQTSETAMRELLAGSALSALLDGEARARVAAEARARVQKTMDEYGAGIALAGVNLSDVRLPDAVQAAQRDAEKAADERQRAVSEAEANAADIVPKAQSAAQRQISDAQAYASLTRATADGDAERFTLLAQAYAKSPEITRNRMYIDTMESILARAHKIILDTKGGSGNMINVPLDKLAEAIRNSAPPAAAAAAAAASGNPVPPPAAAAPAGAATESADDARDRERPER